MKNNEIIVQDSTEIMLKDLENTQKMCSLLMKTPHYQKIGQAGIFAIVEKARSVGVNPIDALNGGMYFVQGKVEMTAAMMNHLIRAKGHSITKGKNSDDTICILHGKRKDNNDTWVESFSIEDAKKAGIYRNQWLKYPKDMLFARALSRLARQLFPDVIKGCYVENEISDAPPLSSEYVQPPICDDTKSEINSINEDEAAHLDKMIGEDHKYRQCVMNFLKNTINLETLEGMPRNTYDKILAVATKKYEERKSRASGHVYGEKEQLAIGV
jgi:hypothetical protein